MSCVATCLAPEENELLPMTSLNFRASATIRFGQDIIAHDSPAFPYSQFRAHPGQIGIFKSGHVLFDELESHDDLLSAFDFTARQVSDIRGIGMIHLR